MTAGLVVRRARVALVASVALRALSWGAALGAMVLLGSALIDALVPLGVGVRLTMRAAAPAAGVLTAAALLWRDRHAASLSHVALWLEERLPALGYALVTRLEEEERGAPPVPAPVAPLPPEALAAPGLARRRAARALVVPIGAMVVAWAVLLALPSGASARVRSPRAGDALARGAGAAPRAGEGRLTILVATVTPPGYSGLEQMVIEEPSRLTALVGSVVRLEGRGVPEGIAATVGDGAPTPAMAGTEPERWMVRVRVPARAVAVRLHDGAHERIVSLEPRADAAPMVSLSRPAHDSVLREGKGRIPLAADASDDLGLARAAFELIVSSGEGETFSFRSTSLGVQRPHGRSASLAATLDLDSLALRPGDILHLRAVARDRNDVSGPGVGVSETRTLRVARAGEYDSVAVEAAAPAEERSVISQRMLIVLAEALERKRRTISRGARLAESSRISADQKTLRRSVSEVIFARLGESAGEHSHDDEPAGAAPSTPDELLRRAEAATIHAAAEGVIDAEGGESPVVAVNRPLLEAYRAMWDASMELDQGEPGRALPHMRRALAAIQRARQAERVYLRGRPPAVVVDVGAVRLTGKERGDPTGRLPRTAAGTERERLASRFLAAVALLRHDAGAAVDSLLLLRVDALGDGDDAAPRLAAAVGELADAVRAGRGAAVPTLVARARRELAGAPIVRDSLAAWGGGGAITP